MDRKAVVKLIKNYIQKFQSILTTEEITNKVNDELKAFYYDHIINITKVIKI